MADILHIGLIPDGNRRWAIANQVNYATACKMAIRNIANFCGFCFRRKVRSISIYIFSKDNLVRSRDELESVIWDGIELFKQTFIDIVNSYHCKIIHAGIPHLLPEVMSDALKEMNRYSSKYDELRIYLLVAYNPMDEINNAILSKAGLPISLQDLWVPEPVDCLIRTAGEPALLSNFLPVQSGYAQIYVSDKYWNDFTEEDFTAIYNKAGSTNMRYGA